mmetsp:Transcript_38149/g.56029  ORF Transcript_38149/g.56029 Transcript_38149/m.56029 type:complete len:112 (-) Transcript_38149:230-565(-)
MTPPDDSKQAEIYVEVSNRTATNETLHIHHFSNKKESSCILTLIPYTHFYISLLFLKLISCSKGKRKVVDGFVRWCKKGNVGLSQQVKVEEVFDEVPTGLHDTFVVDTGRE